MIVVPMPVVGDLLGGSLFAEEHKGNFAQARRAAEQRLEETRQGSEVGLLADALIARGIVQLFQGEPAAALASYREAEQLAPDANRQLRLLSHSTLATYFGYLALPGGGACTPVEVEASWDSEAYSLRQEQRRQMLSPHLTDPITSLEASLVIPLLYNLLLVRSTPSNQATLDTDQRQEQLNKALWLPQQLRALGQQGGVPSAIAFADFLEADVLRRCRHQEAAQQVLGRAGTLYNQLGDQAGLASCYLVWGDWQADPYTSPAVWGCHLKEGTLSNEQAWSLEAEEFSPTGANPNAAAVTYNEAERLFTAAGAQRGLAAVRLRRGYLAALAGDYAQAGTLAREACVAFEVCGDRLGAQLARCHEALSGVGAGRIPEDLETAQALGDWGRQSGCFTFAVGLGLLFSRLGRYWLVRQGDGERALACHRLAEALFHRLGAPSNAAQCLFDQGTAYRAVGEQSAALNFLETACDRFATLDRKQAFLTTIALQQKVLTGNAIYQIYVDRRDADGMDRSNNRLQTLLSAPASSGSSDPPDEARQALFGLAAFQKEQVAFLGPLYRATAARDAGGNADALFEIALEAAQGASPAERDSMEAIVLAEWRRYPEAATAYRQFLARTKDGTFDQLSEQMAVEYGDAGRELLRQHRQHQLERAAIFFTRTRAHNDALSYMQALEKEAGSQWWARDSRPWTRLSDYGEVHEGLNNLPVALDYYQCAIALLESTRERLYRDELRTALAGEQGAKFLYFQAARAAMRLCERAEDQTDRDGAATAAQLGFQFAERGKARALLDLLANRAELVEADRTDNQVIGNWRRLNAQLTAQRGLLAHERRQEQPDRQRIEFLVQQTQTHESELRRIEEQLHATHPAFTSAATIQGKVLPAEKVAEFIPPGAVLLQYYALGEDLLAWAVTHRGIASCHRAAIDVRGLDRQIRAFHRVCAEGGEVEVLGNGLASVLLGPFRDALRQHADVVIVPHGAAHLLPFHALPWEGKPLGASHTLSYLPSASTIQFLPLARSLASAQGILAVGNPAQMAWRPRAGPARSLDPLKAAEVEAAFITRQFPRGRALIGPDATRKAVAEAVSNYPLLHFATHGILSEETPLLSSLALANGETLSLAELMGLRLNADLVVLSACDTGRGETTGGDDVLGLTRGLLAAGARAAVVSLWPVPDVTTSLLMGEFYRRLRNTEPAPVALAKAQEYLRSLDPKSVPAELKRLAGDEFSPLTQLEDVPRFGQAAGRIPQAGGIPPDHPRFWAPFLLVGGPVGS